MEDKDKKKEHYSPIWNEKDVNDMVGKGPCRVTMVCFKDAKGEVQKMVEQVVFIGPGEEQEAEPDMPIPVPEEEKPDQGVADGGKEQG